MNNKGDTESAGGSTIIPMQTIKATKKNNQKADTTLSSVSTALTTKPLSAIKEGSKAEEKIGLNVCPGLGTEITSKSSFPFPLDKVAVPGTEMQETEKQTTITAKCEQKDKNEIEERVEKQSSSEPVVYCLLCQSKLSLHPLMFKNNSDTAVPTSIPIDDNLRLMADNNSVEDVLCTKKSVDASMPTLENMTISDQPVFANKLLLPTSPLMCQSGGNWNLLELIGKSNNPLDVPMCKKCATSIATELQSQLSDLECECVQYKQALDNLLEQRANAPFDQEAAKRQLEQLKNEERELLEQLNLLDNEEQALQQQLKAKIDERRQINERDEQLYRQLRDNHKTLIDQADEQRALKLQIRHAEDQLHRLSRTNVMDMVFHIWVDGEFGTISGFRLGRLRHEKVEWNEINAALGQMAFLLKVIAERLGMEFIGYELVPCGNSSFIRVHKQQSDQQTNRQSGSKTELNSMEELPLYGSGGWRPFGQAPLDKALVAFMDCFIQVEQRLKQYFPTGTQLLPYRMLKDKIVDKDSQYLVKMQLNSEERWTKAMKCLLLNLKRVIGILIPLPTLVAAANSNNNQQLQSHPNSSSDQNVEKHQKSPISG